MKNWCYYNYKTEIFSLINAVSQGFSRENASKRNAENTKKLVILPLIALLTASFIMKVEQIIPFKGFPQVKFLLRDNL